MYYSSSHFTDKEAASHSGLCSLVKVPEAEGEEGNGFYTEQERKKKSHTLIGSSGSHPWLTCSKAGPRLRRFSREKKGETILAIGQAPAMGGYLCCSGNRGSRRPG